MNWLKRNMLALPALVVLLPATVLVVGGYEWWDYFSGRPVIALEPDEESEKPGTVELLGSTFGPAHGTLEAPETFDAPAGSAVLVVELPVDPGDEPYACLTPTLRETETGREWNEGSTRIAVPTMLTTACQGDATEPYVMHLHYLIPETAGESFTIELSVADAHPEFARIPVMFGC